MAKDEDIKYWYCKSGSGLEDYLYDDHPNEDAIRKVQRSMYYFLKREDNGNDQQDLFTYEILESNDESTTSSIKYNRSDNSKSDPFIYFTIYIPEIGKKLLVSKELLISESKIFEKLLKSGEESTIQSSNEWTLDGCEKSLCEYFNLAIQFIHVGKVGLSQNSFNENDSSAIEWKDLMGLLHIACEYQIESLLRAISRTVNQFNALTIGLKCLEFSSYPEISIILQEVCDVLAFNLACIVSDAVYHGQSIDSSYEEDYLFLHASNIFLKEYPFLENISISKGLCHVLNYSIIQPCLKIQSSVPFPIFKGMKSSPYSNDPAHVMIITITLWMLRDIENRYVDAFGMLKQVDWSVCEKEYLHSIIYTLFIGSGQKYPQFEEICDEALDLLHMHTFKREKIISDDKWRKFLTEKSANLGLKQERKDIRREFKFLTLGLDNSGKTTLLNQLKHGKTPQTVSNGLVSTYLHLLKSPTIGFNMETIEYHTSTIHLWDIGGNEMNRSPTRLWNHYYEGTHCIIFVVDSSDKQRLREASEFLFKIAKEDQLNNCPILIFANKKDVSNSLSTIDLVGSMKIHSLKKREWFVQPCSAITGNELSDGLDWAIKKCEKNNSTAKPNVSIRYSHFGNNIR